MEWSNLPVAVSVVLQTVISPKRFFHLEKIWDKKVGDRRQEIVFIGIDLDTEKLQKLLDACLVDE